MGFDLHLHSHYSDGRLAPAELVRECKKIGLEMIALTDHETIGGLREAIEEGRKSGIKVVPGIEFTADDYEGKEQHMLGYFIDFDCKSSLLESFLSVWEQTKEQQIKEILAKLANFGFEIEFKEVVSQVRGYIGRSHIAYAVFASKNLKNSAVLKQFGIETMGQFFHKLLREDSPMSIYASRERPQVKDVIELIKKMGGIAVWTHPFWKGDDSAKILEKSRTFQQFGLKGIEVCYSRHFHSKEKALALRDISQQLGLYETAGSDFHSFEMNIYNKIADFDTFGLELKLHPKFLEASSFVI